MGGTDAHEGPGEQAYDPYDRQNDPHDNDNLPDLLVPVKEEVSDEIGPRRRGMDPDV